MGSVASRRRGGWRAVLFGLLGAFFLLGSARATEHHFTLRGCGLGFWFHKTQEFGNGNVEIFSDDRFRGGLGAGVDGELEIRDWIGLDLGFFQVAVKQRNRVVEKPTPFRPGSLSEETTQIQLRSPALGLYFHPLPHHRSALYIGPFASAELYQGGFRNFKSHFGYGVVLGSDIPLGNRGWALTGSARVLATWIDDQVPPGDNVVGYVFGLGVAYRH